MAHERGPIVSQYVYFGGELSQVNPLRIVDDNDDGQLLWLPRGASVWRAEPPGGACLRSIAREDWPVGGFPMRPAEWSLPSTLFYLPAGAAYSVWWFFEPSGEFRNWYVNFERRERRADALHVVDMELDLVVKPGRDWSWKDEESFVDKTGHPSFWTADEATAIRAAAAQVVELVEAGRFPFDGTWCDFLPDPAWAMPPRPAYSPAVTKT